MGVTEDDTNLRGGSTLPGELADLLDDLVGGGLEPSGSSAGVGESRGRYALAVAVKSTHLVESSSWWSAVVVVVEGVVAMRLEAAFVVMFIKVKIVWSGNFFAYLGQTSVIMSRMCGPTLAKLEYPRITCTMDPDEKTKALCKFSICPFSLKVLLQVYGRSALFSQSTCGCISEN